MCKIKYEYQQFLTWATKNDVEVQTVDTNAWIVLDTQINVFLDTKTKVTGAREVLFAQLVLTYL